MRILTMLEGVTTNSNGTVMNPQSPAFGEGIFQTEFTAGSGDIELQGRLRPDAVWQEITTHSDSSDAEVVALFPEMRCCDQSGLSSATVSAWLLF